MKNLLFGGALSLLPLSLTAQVTVSGHITNPTGKEVMILVETNNPLDEQQQYTAPLGTEGKFSIEIPLEEARNGRLVHGSESTALYLQPGKSVTASLNAQQFDESLTYTGPGAAPNNYLAKLFLLQEEELGENMSWERNLEPEAFKAKATALKEKENQLLNDYKANVPSAFFSEQLLNNKYYWAFRLMRYPSFKAYFSGVDSAIQMSDSYMDYTVEAPLINEKALNSVGYRDYLMESVYTNAGKNSNNTAEDWYERALIEEINQYGGAIGNYVKASVYIHLVGQAKTYMVENEVKAFLADSGAAKYHQKLQTLLATWAALEKGRPAPNFTFITLEGKETSLAAYKGKVVYLDFWASWCGPCLGEMPHSKSLQENFANRDDVVFLYLSIDDDEKAWRSMIEKKNIEGEHGWSQGWSSAAPVAYNVQYIPRYVLVAKDGTILDANTSRPSAEETATRITEALAQQ